MDKILKSLPFTTLSYQKRWELDVQAFLVDYIGHVGVVEGCIGEYGNRSDEAENKTGTEDVE